jgi:hypothetical protein
MPGDFKGKLYRKKSNESLYTGLQGTTSKYYFPEILEKILHSAYMENTPKDE